MRELSSSAAAALASGSVALQLLLELQFTGGTLLLTTSRTDIKDFDSPPNTYLAVGTVGQIGVVEDKQSEIAGLSLTFSGVDVSIIAIALGEQVRGRPLYLKQATLDANTGELLSIDPLWSGQISTMALSQEKNTATVQIAAEHRGVLFSRSKPVRYTDADQQREHPGDRCLEYIISQSQVQDVWPAASYFKR